VRFGQVVGTVAFVKAFVSVRKPLRTANTSSEQQAARLEAGGLAHVVSSCKAEVAETFPGVAEHDQTFLVISAVVELELVRSVARLRGPVPDAGIDGSVRLHSLCIVWVDADLKTNTQANEQSQ